MSESFVKNTLESKRPSGLVSTNKRDKNTPLNKLPEFITEKTCARINSIPKFESHYSRPRSQQLYLGSDLNRAKMYKCTLCIVKTKNFKKFYWEVFFEIQYGVCLWYLILSKLCGAHNTSHLESYMGLMR